MRKYRAFYKPFNNNYIGEIFLSAVGNIASVWKKAFMIMLDNFI
ncbi:MAG: hypothetical protein ABIL44_05910 [candidate division WOR-3 bacterium]